MKHTITHTTCRCVKCRRKKEAYGFREFYEGGYEGVVRLPKKGAWILVKKSPPTEYTVPPLSIWFATEWPYSFNSHGQYRIKIVTPKGDLGLIAEELESEYTVVDPTKFYKYVGEGMEIKFFGNTKGVPEQALFYLRSRGIAKEDAIGMLLGQIKSHGVCWLEASEEIINVFSRGWPKERNTAVSVTVR